MSRNGRFRTIQTERPRRTAFDLSHDLKTSCDMGQLIPIYFQECVPGDTFSLGQTVLARMQPLVAPIMHPIKLQVHTFFCPTRLLMGRNLMEYDASIGTEPDLGDDPNLTFASVEPEWEDFIRGGDTGDEDIALPLWLGTAGTDPSRRVGSLWDYFRHPTNITLGTASLPLAFDKRAYNLVYNEYYIDSELDQMVSLDDESLKYRRWEKDYFTSARPWQQRGTSPSFPISYDLTGLASWLNSNILVSTVAAGTTMPTNAVTTPGFDYSAANPDVMRIVGFGADGGLSNARNWYANFASEVFGNATVGFDINDLRTAVQIQRFLELGARSGKRYVEWLRAFFGVSPSDSRLQRPEYVGGITVPLVVSEVLQTMSSTPDSPQGNMAGHGITAGSQFVGKYHCQEFGYLISIASIMPEPVYQQGVARQSLRRSRYDYYFPQFAHLSEQAIKNVELCATGTANDEGNFGYQGRYDEMRIVPSAVTGLMRDSLDFWHISRKFDISAPPKLNPEFISTEGTIRKDIFAFYEETPEANGFILTFGNMVKAIRPLPYYGTPGLMDHN